MAQTCSCHQPVATAPAAGPVSARETVGEVVQRMPGSLEVMKRLGINHCCGAQLSLAEAAAAAGLPVDTLLAALAEVR